MFWPMYPQTREPAMISLATFALGTALYTVAPSSPVPRIPTAAAVLQEPPQIDDLVNVSGAPNTFYLSQDLLPHRNCLVYNGTTVRVGQREGRRIDDMIPAGPSCCWMLTGALRTDSNGNHYVRANALVNDQPCEVADYGGFAIFECTSGYQVWPSTTPGSFSYDPDHPGEPWTAAASWNAGGDWANW